MSAVPEIPPPLIRRRRNPILLAVAGGLLLLGTGLCLGLVAGADAGTFPDWIAATATVAAFSAAAVAAWYAYGALKVEELREDRWLATQRQAQASLIAAWPGELQHHWIGHDEMGGSIVKGYEGVEVKLRNASDVPVTAVRVDATLVVDRRSDSPVRLHLGLREIAKILEPAAEPVTKYLPADSPVDPEIYKPGNSCRLPWPERGPAWFRVRLAH